MISFAVSLLLKLEQATTKKSFSNCANFFLILKIRNLLVNNEIILKKTNLIIKLKINLNS